MSTPAYESDPRWIEARNDLLAHSEKRSDPTGDLLEGLRLAIRVSQIEMAYEPDPSSPWAFLTDPPQPLKT